MTTSLYDCAAAIGAVFVAWNVLKLCISIWRKYRNFIVAQRGPPSVDLRTLGSWAVVTGATDGIGKEYAIQLAAEHRLNIVLISRSIDRLNNVAREIESNSGVKTLCIPVDFTGGLEIYDTIKSAIAGLDIAILVNNVGSAVEHPDYFCNDDDNQALRDNFNHIHVNCGAATLLTRMVLPGLLAKKKGAVVFISSTAGIFTLPMLANYSACKAYLDFFCRALNAEYRCQGIIFQVVLAGYVSTKLGKIPPAMLSPTPRDFVRSAMRLIGVETRTTGYFPHEMLKEIMECIPVPERVREAVSILFSKRQRSVGIQYVAALKASEQKRQ